jgi:hypothetical protein
LEQTLFHPLHLLGGSFDVLPATANLHETSLQRETAPNGAAYVVARIRLFANLGGPVYYAVVGTPIS